MSDENPPTKLCRGPCGERKPLDAFYRAKLGRFGREAKCKICSDNAKLVPFNNDRALKNARQRAKYHEDPTRYSATNKRYRDANKEKEGADQKRWREENPDSFKKWGSANWRNFLTHLLKAKRNFLARSKNAQKRHTIMDLTVDQLLFVLERQSYKCALTKRPMTHILGQKKVPTNASLDRIAAGGAYSVENIQLTCHAANAFRGNLPIDEWINDWLRPIVETYDSKINERNESAPTSVPYQAAVERAPSQELVSAEEKTRLASGSVLHWFPPPAPASEEMAA